MPLINAATREIHYKLVYYGPSASGKTANLRFVQQRAAPNQPDALRSWTDDEGRTVFFDHLSLAFGVLHGFQTHMHVFAVPGADAYAHTRTMLLANSDGIVFVADSRPEAQIANHASLHELQTSLQTHALSDVPIVMQFNRRDAPDALALPVLSEQLQGPWSHIEANAASGVGVLTTLKTVSDLVFAKL